MKLKMFPLGVNGNLIGKDEFGYCLKMGQGFCAQGVDTINFWCPTGKNRICSIDLTLDAQTDGEKDDLKRRWHWDGNMNEPTITPSIHCKEAPRCGWHGTITKGEWK